MSVSFTFDSVGQGQPQYVLKLDPSSSDERTTQIFREMTFFLSKGPNTLGHEKSLKDGLEFHINMIRTHWVGDGESALGGSAGHEKLKPLLSDGYKVSSYEDSDDGDHVIVTLKKEEATKTVEIPCGDRHAPLIDGIYTTLLVATALFKDVTFNITPQAQEFLGGITPFGLDAATSDKPELEGLQEPTYSYASRLESAIRSLKGKEGVVAIAEENLSAPVGADGRISLTEKSQKVTTYQARELLAALGEGYVTKSRKTLPELYGKVEEQTFMTYYTPLDQAIARCNKFIAEHQPSSPKVLSEKRVVALCKTNVTSKEEVTSPKKEKPQAPVKQRKSFFQKMFFHFKNALKAFWNLITRPFRR